MELPEEPPTPPVVPGAPDPPSPPVDPGKANAAFAQLRLENEANKKRADDLAAKITDLERKDLDELNRTKLELEDFRKKATELEPIRDAHGRFVSSIEAFCKAEIERLPEEKRAAIEKLTQHVPLDERLNAIREAATAIGVGPISGGTHTQPGGGSPDPPGSPVPAKPLTVDELSKLSFKEIMKARGVTPVDATLAKRMGEMEKQIADLAAARK